MLEGKLGAFPSSDALILVRSVFELYLTHEFLEGRPWAGAYLLSRTLPKDGRQFSYSQRSNGKIDKRKVVFHSTGAEFPSYVSYYKMAQLAIFQEDEVLFDRLYSRLSNEVHFSFDNWHEYWREGGGRTSRAANPSEVTAMFLITIALLADSVERSRTHTKLVNRDARFLKKRATSSLFFLLSNVDEAPSNTFLDEEFLTCLSRRLAK